MLIAVMTDVEAVMSQQQTHTFRAVNRPNLTFVSWAFQWQDRALTSLLSPRARLK